MLQAVFADGKVEFVFHSSGGAQDFFEQRCDDVPEVSWQLVYADLCQAANGTVCTKCCPACYLTTGGVDINPAFAPATAQQRQQMIQWLRDQGDMLDEAVDGEFDPRETFEDVRRRVDAHDQHRKDDALYSDE